MLGGEGSASGLFTNARGVAFDAYQRIFVSDLGNNRIQVFEPSGKVLGIVGKLGSPTGVCLHGVNLVVAEYSQRQVSLRQPSGQQIWASTYPLQDPWGVATSPDGTVVAVADQGNHRIVLLHASTGLMKAVVGSKGKDPGQLQYPMDVAFTPQGHLVITDRDNARVQVLSQEGTPLLVAGGPGNTPGLFAQPWGVGLTPDGCLVSPPSRCTDSLTPLPLLPTPVSLRTHTKVVADRGNSRVQVWLPLFPLRSHCSRCFLRLVLCCPSGPRRPSPSVWLYPRQAPSSSP